MRRQGAFRGILLLLTLAGCPTRTIYYDAGAGGDGGHQGGTSGHDFGAAGEIGSGGPGGGVVTGSAGAAGHQGMAGGSGAASAGAAGGASSAGTAGNVGGSAGTIGATGSAGSGGSPAAFCADTTADPKNCGKCGHDCLGGTCAASQCQPLLLGQFTGNPNNLSVASQFIYVTTDSGYIARVNKDGSDLKPFAMPAFTSTAFQGTPVAEDGDRAFFVWNGNPLRLAYCAISSCDSSITPVGGPYSQYFAVDAPDHKIAWIDYSPSQFWTASTTGTPAGTAVPGGTLADGSTGSRVLYAQGGLYFSNGPSIQRLPLSGGSQTTVGYTSTMATSIALMVLAANSTSLFFGDGSAIFSTPLPSGNGAPGSKLIDGNYSFVADDTSAYWVSTGIQTCNVGSCGTTQKPVAGHSGAYVEEIGLDSMALYWAESATIPGQNIDAFTLWKVAR